jgi:hypothetical protein
MAMRVVTVSHTPDTVIEALTTKPDHNGPWQLAGGPSGLQFGLRP